MNNIKKVLLKFCYILGIILVFVGISILGYTAYNKLFGFISFALGGFLCFIYHSILYKIEMKKNDIINNKKYLINHIIIVIGILFAFIFIWIKFSTPLSSFGN